MSCAHFAGCGDTATILVLSQALDIDVYLFLSPDERLTGSDLHNCCKLLRFRKAGETNSSARRLCCRIHDSHYTFLEKYKKDGGKMPPAADQEHYLNGTHDVATGTYAT